MKSKSGEKTVRPRFIYCLRRRMESRRIMPKKTQEIEIEKAQLDSLLTLHQAATTNCLDFLGTALILHDCTTPSKIAQTYAIKLLPGEGGLRIKAGGVG